MWDDLIGIRVKISRPDVRHLRSCHLLPWRKVYPDRSNTLGRRAISRSGPFNPTPICVAQRFIRPDEKRSGSQSTTHIQIGIRQCELVNESSFTIERLHHAVKNLDQPSSAFKDVWAANTSEAPELYHAESEALIKWTRPTRVAVGGHSTRLLSAPSAVTPKRRERKTCQKCARP